MKTSGQNVGLNLADSLQMTIKSTTKAGHLGRDPYVLEGEMDRVLNVHGQQLILHPFIVDSMGFSGTLLHVLVHIAGDLFLSMSSDGRDQKVTAILVDGGLCDLNEIDNFEVLYPTKAWSRRYLYEALSQGIVASFERAFGSDVWMDMGTEWILDYIEKRDKEDALTKPFIRTENKRTESKK